MKPQPGAGVGDTVIAASTIVLAVLAVTFFAQASWPPGQTWTIWPVVKLLSRVINGIWLMARLRPRPLSLMGHRPEFRKTYLEKSYCKRPR